MLSHYGSTQRNLLTVMTAIGSHRPTLRQLQKLTDMKTRYLRYMVTILRRHAIVKGERIGDEYRYRLSPEAFGEHIRIRYAKALEGLAKKGESSHGRRKRGTGNHLRICGRTEHNVDIQNCNPSGRINLFRLYSRCHSFRTNWCRHKVGLRTRNSCPSQNGRLRANGA